MRDDEFREKLRGALGEPPASMAPPSFAPAGPRPPRIYPTAMGALAVALAVLLVLVLVGTRGGWNPRGSVVPLGKPTPFPTAASAFPCALPVMVEGEAPGAPVSARIGFVNVPSGSFRVDPRASAGSNYYSAALGRWLPAMQRTVSPDGTSYAYVKLMPEGAGYSSFTSSELHVVYAPSNEDRKLWSSVDGIDVVMWQPTGILVSTVPKQGGVMLLWRIDPANGHVARAPQSADPGRPPLAAMPNGGSSSYMGSDVQGDSVFRLGSRDPGTKYSVIVVQSGRTITIYSGTQGDARDFDPAGISFDIHGIWFGNYDGKWAWLWSPTSGLQGFKVSGLPAALPGGDVLFFPQGPCVPGEFTGVAAAAFAHPTPSPSPSVPAVDWSVLLARPLVLPAMPASGGCPVSPQQNLAVTTSTGKGGPNYGYGQWPAFVSGQIYWYSAGSQGVVFLVSPEYKGPIIVRSKRLDGSGSLGIAAGPGPSGPSVALPGGTLGIPVTSSPPYWGVWFGVMVPTAAGCYGIQIDGNSWSSVAVIQVQKGPPPPG